MGQTAPCNDETKPNAVEQARRRDHFSVYAAERKIMPAKPICCKVRKQRYAMQRIFVVY